MNSAKLQHFTVWFDNSEEYHHLKSEIFTQDTYYFESETPTPVIIDAGAHIGLATLYFKKLYPAAHITAIEPNPESFSLLEKNIFENVLDDIELHQVALSDQSGTQAFFHDASTTHWHSTAGFQRGSWTGDQKSQEIRVPTQPLSDFLTQPIDFLKLDIEGAEQEVLRASRNHLHLVKRMMIEFHPTPDQSLTRVCELLEQQGFSFTLYKGDEEVKLKRARGLILIEAWQR